MAEISGAIFDCDGTFIDSMTMWYGAFDHLLAAYDVTAPAGFKERVEPMTIPDSCALIHAELGIGASGAALVDELEAYVAHEYETSIKVIPGARELVEGLSAADVRLIVASSTTSRLVRGALAVHGLLGYFSDVICTAEVRDGRDKDCPDVYLEALERLGTPREETWVFEDAPFGIRTARQAGFHVAAIYNEGDGRDEAFVRSWADIFSRGYASLSLEAIRGFDDAARRPMPEE